MSARLALCLLVACVPVPSVSQLPGPKVYACEVESGAELVDLELCFDRGPDELEDQLWAAYGGFAICNPTKRHAGQCFYCCGPDCGRGSNAFNGSWCPS